MERYKQFIARINHFAFLALLIALPFPRPIIHVCWLVWAFTWLLELRFLDRTNIRRSSGILYLSIGVGVWLAWNILSLLWASDTHAAWGSIERYISLLAVPLVGIWGLNEQYDWRRCLRVFLYACVLSVGIYIFAHYWLINWRIAWDWHATEIIPIDWLHMDNLLLAMKHRIHYTDVLCMCIPCMALLFHRRDWKQVGLMSIVLFAGIWMSGSRIALLNLLIVVVLTLYWRYMRRLSQPMRLASIIGVLIVIGIGALSIYRWHPRNEGRSISETLMVQQNLHEPSPEPRAAIWETAMETPQDYLLYGIGAGNATNYLVQKYAEKGWSEYALKRYSPHNQFLGVCMDLGIVAAVLFVLFWLGIPWFYSGDKRYWAFCALGICLPTMMTEMVLGGIEGIVFVCVLFLLGTLLPDSTRQSDAASEQ